MPKGKKYDAAEKHFRQILEKERKDKHNALQRCAEVSNQLDVVTKERDALQAQVVELRDEIEQMQKLLSMTPEEREQYIRSCHGASAAAQLFIPFADRLGY